MQELTEAYNQAVANFEKFWEEHKAIMDEYLLLKSIYEIAEEKIKQEMRAKGENATTATKRFELTPVYKKWVDYETAKKLIPKKDLSRFEELVTVDVKVDFPQFKKLCEDGTFPLEALIESYREEPMTPRIIEKRSN